VINLLQVKDFVLSLKAMTDLFFIRRTLTLAARARGMTNPNPMVGALLVKNGRIISEGYHKKAGTPHAEVIAIDRAGKKAAGATLYVSLEPCCHKDKRTPPCTQKIIESGIRKVVVSMKDPNPKVSGKGIEELKKAGIEVVSGILEEKAQKLNEFYIKHVTTGMPFVVMKAAMTLDGKIATPAGESKWITGEKARHAVQKLRANVDAIMTAIGTVKADNPRLTCRIKEDKNTVRVIIDPLLEIGPDSNILCTPPDTMIVTRSISAASSRQSVQENERAGMGNEQREKKGRLLKEKGIRLIEYATEKVDLPWLMKELGRMGIISVLVEGGSSLNSYCLESGIVDKVMFFIAPKIIGGRESFTAIGGKAFRTLQEAHRIVNVRVKKYGEDILIEGYIERNR
jgi:diaminohydroxyphosphoribosylaminopyrimidine deaminase / 5-amino-6-(5-phosphoribosylamino)uracil reductase